MKKRILPEGRRDVSAIVVLRGFPGGIGRKWREGKEKTIFPLLGKSLNMIHNSEDSKTTGNKVSR